MNGHVQMFLCAFENHKVHIKHIKYILLYKVYIIDLKNPEKKLLE